MTIYAASYTGVMVDLLPTFVKEVLAAWQYGERRKDLQVAAQDVTRAARLHQSRHEM